MVGGNLSLSNFAGKKSTTLASLPQLSCTTIFPRAPAIKMHYFAVYKRSGFEIKPQIRNLFNSGQLLQRAQLL
jgi:hypothetical protein